MHDASSPSSDTQIAVVGMAGRFPGARTPDELWANVRAGVESIRPLSEAELRAAGVSDHDLADPDYVRVAAPLDDVELFDAGFFGFSPKEASILDPQHRHFLECAWEALESAGHPPERFNGAIGVFAGCGMNAYFMFHLLSHPELVRSTGLFLLRHTGNDKDFLPTRVSYLLNLTGPSMAVQTACSTSLVAIHLATQHLLNGECDLALAGGVTIELPQRVGYHYRPGEILSPDGHCRAFDASAQGTVFGSGVGVVALRRLRDAIEDGDEIHAVIRGSAVNNDGASKVGYLAPSVEGQAASIAEALAVAGLTADDIGYVEAHGTGTPVGDPIEIAALTQAFRQTTTRTSFCGIGSLKTNIGHLDTAAGVASFIKVVQALKHRELPPSLHFERPNPAIDFAATPFYVNRDLSPWPSTGAPRRAGVSSLGVGGTNAHVIVEEAPPRMSTPAARSHAVVLLSARSPESLEALAERYAAHFERQPDVDLADAAYTTAVGRRAFEYRRAVVGQSAADLTARLRQPDGRRATRVAPGEAPSVVMMFPGGGTQYPDMARDLHREEPVFRAAMERGLALAERRGHPYLRSLLFPAAENVQEAARALERPLASLLSVFLVEYALAELWLSWGVRPSALIGHSLGEYAAAVLAEVMSFEDAFGIVLKRGEIFERLPEGAMLSVSMPAAALTALPAFDGLALAAVNGPELSVASGTIEGIDALERDLSGRGVECRRLHIAVAAHSAMLDPFLDEFRQVVDAVPLRASRVPMASNLTGRWADPAEVATPDYWVRHLRETVRFSEGLSTVLEEPGRVLLEVGPGQTLTALARLHRHDGKVPNVVPSLRHPHETAHDSQTVLDALGRLWTLGVAVDWAAFYAGETRRRVSLPTYAFERKRYWIDRRELAIESEGKVEAPEPPRPVLERLPSVADWGAERTWAAAPPDPDVEDGPSRWLVLGEAAGIGGAVAAALGRLHHDVTLVTEGAAFHALGPNRYELDPAAPDGYTRLIEALASNGGLPRRIVHTWLADAEASESSVDRQQRLGFDAIVALIRALGAHDAESAIALTVVTAGLERLPDDREVAGPARATVSGPVRVLAREYPSMRGRMVDLPLDTNPGDAIVSDALVREVLAPIDVAAVALRPRGRFVERFEPRPLEASSGIAGFVPGGAYLITGGMSGIALALANGLAPLGAKLALVTRTPLPPRSQWADAAGRAGWSPEVARRVSAVERLEAAGAEVLTIAADVSDAGAMRAAIAETTRRFSRLDGILHAAGTIDDGLMQVKTAAEMSAVLAPKVRGTLALHDALAPDWPGFLVLFSSTSAFLGLPGQAAYAGANAFLNAFARACDGRLPRRTIAVQWGVWKDAGMAARALGVERPGGTPVHPWLGVEVERSADRAVFVAEWRARDLWMLDEHRRHDGSALAPGTGFIEVIRAAAARCLGSETLSIHDLLFEAPLAISGDATVQVRTDLRRESEGAWTAAVSSLAEGRMEWTEHVSGRVTALDPGAASPADNLPAPSSCHPIAGGSDMDVRAKQGRHVRFGPRWRSPAQASLADGVAHLSVSLDRAFAGEVSAFKAHPALLDLATACGLALLPAYGECRDLYVPFSYRALHLHGPLPASIVAVARLTGDPDPSGSTATFDVTISDDRGRVAATISEFTMRRVDAGQLTSNAAPEASMSPAPERPLLESLVALGITAAEGLEALTRIIAAPARSEIIVSPVAPHALLAQVERETRPRASASARAVRHGASENADAALGIEDAIAAMWTDLLGVEEVGPDDNFFELGGHSLTAVRLVSRIEKRFKTRLRLSTLFEAPTVRQLAALVQAPSAGPSFRSLTALRAGGSKPPLFVVHGVGGEVLAYRELAEALDPERPVYAFRSLGHYEGEEPIADIGEQADLYIQEMRAFRPEGPYVLAGYSHGGRVVFEMARRLQAQGQDVSFLGIIDMWPCEGLPHPRFYPVRWVANFTRWVVEDLARGSWREHRDRLRRLGELTARKVSQLASGSRARTRDVTDDISIAHLPDRIQRTYRTNFDAFIRYRPGIYRGTVHVFRATAQPLSAPLLPDHGWTPFVDGRVIVHVVPGNHSHILVPPKVQRLAHELARAIDAAEAGASGETAVQPSTAVNAVLTSHS